MSDAFTHPLARQAQVWTTEGVKGKPGKLLVVITTLELNSHSKGFKADKLKRLSDAAREWLANNPGEANDILLISRPRDWAGDHQRP